MRKTRLVDLHPKFLSYTGRDGDPIDALRFDCPEGHEECRHTVRFTPALDGSTSKPQRNGANWTRVGETFYTLSLYPSIRRVPVYVSREAALAQGCIPDQVIAPLLCAVHIFITRGAIEFCSDSH